MEVSLRYTPVTGRLHTRYAPVRRSSAECCHSLLPLDLHVLSLPLAFILSQDQTLHCKNCFLPFELSFNAFLHLGIASKLALLSTSETVLTRLRVFHISIYVKRHTLSLSSHPFQCPLAFARVLFRGFQQPPLLGESGCKDTTIFQTTKIFFRVFWCLLV